MAEATNLCIQLGEVQMVNGLRSRSGKAGGIRVGSGFALGDFWRKEEVVMLEVISQIIVIVSNVRDQ